MLMRSVGSRHITMPNFLKTGLSKAKILWFFDFPKAAAAILDFGNVIGNCGGEERDASACQILSKSVDPLQR